MGLSTSLWDILDHHRREPKILDSRDVGTSQQVTSARPLQWKVGVRAAVILAAGILVVIVGAAFVRSLTPAPAPLPVPEALSAQSDSSEDNAIVVHVVGAVVAPGVVSLPESSRVQDALEHAGGPLEDAELSGVNLARVVFDGEQIVVPRRGDPPASLPGVDAGPVRLSEADQATLETLPRIGPATAERIIAWREEHGPFRSLEDLLAISGIGPATLESLADRAVP